VPPNIQTLSAVDLDRELSAGGQIIESFRLLAQVRVQASVRGNVFTPNVCQSVSVKRTETWDIEMVSPRRIVGVGVRGVSSRLEQGAGYLQ
jgi:hypothetical protein